MPTFHISKQFTLAPDRGCSRRNVNQLNVWKAACAIFLFCAATATLAGAQTFTVVEEFPNTVFPTGALVQGVDGELYGTTMVGGLGNGMVYRVTSSGTVTMVYDFCASPSCPDGYAPSGLTLATGDNFYGTTSGPAANDTVFRLTPGGTLTTLYRFCTQASCLDGNHPSNLFQATDGNLYGIADVGGPNVWPGTVFKLTLAGKLTTLHGFCAQANCANSSYPVGLTQASDGNFYGTTSTGGNIASIPLRLRHSLQNYRNGHVDHATHLPWP